VRCCGVDLRSDGGRWSIRLDLVLFASTRQALSLSSARGDLLVRGEGEREIDAAQESARESLDHDHEVQSLAAGL
jgi:hypothetical protein